MKKKIIMSVLIFLTTAYQAMCDKLYKPMLISSGSVGDVFCLGFAPEGKSIAVSSGKGEVSLWKISGNRIVFDSKLLDNYTSSVDSVAFSPDNKTMAIGLGDQKIIIRKEGFLNKQGYTQMLDGLPGGNLVSFSHDGTILTARSLCFKKIKIFSLNNNFVWNFSQDIIDPSGIATSVAWSPCGKFLAFGAKNKHIVILKKNTYQLWEVSQLLKGHTKSIRSLVFSHDGSSIASCSYDKTIRIWKKKENDVWVLAQILTGHEAFVSSILFSADSNMMASASDDDTIRIWSKKRGVWTCSCVLQSNMKDIHSIQFWSQDHELIAVSCLGELKIWDISLPLYMSYKALISRFKDIAIDFKK